MWVDVASDSERLRDVLPSSLISPQQCPLDEPLLANACLGACRNGGRPPKTFLTDDFALRKRWKPDNASSAAGAWSGLAALFAEVVRTGTSSAGSEPQECSLLLAGDSVTHDSFVHVFAGAISLGFTLTSCTMRTPNDAGAAYMNRFFKSAGGASRLALDGGSADALNTAASDLLSAAAPSTRCLIANTSSSSSSSGGAGPRFGGWAEATFEVSRSSLRQHRRHGGSGGGPAPSCRRLILRYAALAELVSTASSSSSSSSSGRSRLAETMLYHGGASTTVLLNQGLWANAASQMSTILDLGTRPILDAIAALPASRRPNVLWRETTPQHFIGTSGTGLYAEKKNPPRCGPVTADGSAAAKARWRNKQFYKWSRPWRSSNRDSNRSLDLDIVKAFDAFLPRSDLHVSPDCTHFCFSPYAWEPVWQDAATKLAAMTARRRARGEVASNE